MSLFAILCGTLPVGYAIWPNIISYLIGWLITGAWTYLFCVRVVNATGRFSPLLEGWLRFVKKGNSELEVLRVDTVKFFNEEATIAVADKEEGSEEDNLIKTKDGSVGEESPPTFDEESPEKDEESPDKDDVESAEEAVPVEEATDSSFHRQSTSNSEVYA